MFKPKGFTPTSFQTKGDFLLLPFQVGSYRPFFLVFRLCARDLSFSVDKTSLSFSLDMGSIVRSARITLLLGIVIGFRFPSLLLVLNFIGPNVEIKGLVSWDSLWPRLGEPKRVAWALSFAGFKFGCLFCVTMGPKESSSSEAG